MDGDWGLGIGPIPNPQSPIPNFQIIFINNLFVFLLFNVINNKMLTSYK